MALRVTFARGSSFVRLTLRVKLTLIVFTATIALIAVIVGGAISGLRQAEHLANVEGRLIPRLQFGPEIGASFERLRQQMRDAVSAQDRPALDATIAQRERLLHLLVQAAPMLKPGDAAELQTALQDYWTSAFSISQRMIDGETGEQIVRDMEQLLARDRHAVEVLERTTRVGEQELKASFEAIGSVASDAERFRLVIGVGGLVLVVVFSVWVTTGILRTLNSLSSGLDRFATGEFREKIPVSNEDELGDVARDANRMADSLEQLGRLRDRDDWLRATQMGLSDQLRDDAGPNELARRALWYLCRHLGVGLGALYLSDGTDVLRLVSEFAGGPRIEEGGEVRRQVKLGQGLLGQAALSDEVVVVDDVPATFANIWSGLGTAPICTLVLVPLTHLKRRVGMLELGLLKPCSEQTRELLSLIGEPLALALSVAEGRAQQTELLAKTRDQAARLSAQEEELRVRNQDLVEQQTELRHANEELELQRGALSQRNIELEETRNRVQQKAEELARVSTYKSQFLANMSHELRTPLNSMLLLSGILSENATGNLTGKQVEYASTVHVAGQDLLTLINQILDLAKIEAGKQEVELEVVSLSALAEHARQVFAPLAGQKGLKFEVQVDSTSPDILTTDRHRVQRILANLLGNAIKFTERGKVSLAIGVPALHLTPNLKDPSESRGKRAWVAFSVTDTGPGIEPAARERIFAPFEQAESTSNRKHAGTGLGLAIARESALLLGGDLVLESTLGVGSAFTCVLPDLVDQVTRVARTENRAPAPPLVDDRQQLAADEECVLVIEDDAPFAEQIMEAIRARSFKCVLATTGAEGLEAARKHLPRGIILDVGLPDIDGWTVMERLKHDPVTRAIPVHFVSATDAPQRGLALGAVGYLVKPARLSEVTELVRVMTSNATEREQRVLVVEDNPHEGESLVKLLSSVGGLIEHVLTANDALGALAQREFDCVVLDLGLPDMDGLALLEALSSKSGQRRPRIIVHTARTLTKAEHMRLQQYAEPVIQKEPSSGNRVLEEVREFVSRVEQQPVVHSVRLPVSVSTDALVGRRVLLTDDDMRTVYALSALLRSWGAEVSVADSGTEALSVLEREPGFDFVLMDIMMPGMDGYETMRRIRQEPRFAELPVFALTASAMKGERERCLSAGASDYLPKPLQSAQLLEMLRGWLMQAEAQS